MKNKWVAAPYLSEQAPINIYALKYFKHKIYAHTYTHLPLLIGSLCGKFMRHI